MSTVAPSAIAIIADGGLGASLDEALRGAGLATTLVAPGTPFTDNQCLTIVALEGQSFAALLECQQTLARQARTTMFVTVEGGYAIQGAVTVPALSACLECRLLTSLTSRGMTSEALPRLLAGHTDKATALSAVARASVLKEVVRVALSMDTQGANPAFTTAVVHGPEGAQDVPMLPHAECRTCTERFPLTAPYANAARAQLARMLELEAFAAELTYSSAPAPHPDRYRTVGILGGGTAGYLAALIFRRRFPELEVTLIESSRIPIISVGEASTPEMVRFLHAPTLLGFDIADFHRRVCPAFKLGIRFQWGAHTDAAFSYPFQYAPLIDPMIYDGHLESQSVASCLMQADRVPLLDAGAGRTHSLLDTTRFAYHLDNERFVAYLKREAEQRGIRYLDTEIRNAAVRSNGEEIDYLVTDAGDKLQFDLYIDASGFRSVLMGGALKSPFHSYASTLLTDRAIATKVANDGLIRPYTTARTFDAGWCWSIPFEDGDHVGYVYASDFKSDDQAVAEMRKAHPHMGEPRHVKFRSGRHGDFFKGNVVAIGNSYAFVEPLESTALHMVIYELEYLTNHLPLKSDRASKQQLSLKMNSLWDQLRGFLSVHYRYNHRVDSEFWRSARSAATDDCAEQRIAMFAERAPLSDRPSLFYSIVAPDFFAGDHAYDSLLFGQNVAARLGPPRQSRPDWEMRARLRRDIANHALTQAAALPLLREQQPELLAQFINNPSSWVHHWIAR